MLASVHRVMRPDRLVKKVELVYCEVTTSYEGAGHHIPVLLSKTAPELISRPRCSAGGSDKDVCGASTRMYRNDLQGTHVTTWRAFQI